MNIQKKSSWEIRLSAVNSVMIIGFMTGLLAASFYIGFASGQHVGFEAAQSAALANLPKIPIPQAELEDGSLEEIGSDVFAKLTSPADRNEAALPKEMPELGEIKDAAVAPIVIEGEKKKDLSTLEIPSTTTQKTDLLGESLGTLAEKAETVRKEESTQMAQIDAPIVHGSMDKAALKPTESSRVESQIQADSNVIAAVKKEEPPVAALEKPVTSKAVVVVKDEKKEVAKIETKNDLGFIRERIPAGWYVQVAAPRKLQEANDTAAKLKRSGYNVMIETARVRGEEYFRIIVGPEGNRADSDKVLNRLKRDSSVKGDPFVRAVK